MNFGRLLIVLILLTAYQSQAQISYGGVPLAFEFPDRNTPETSVIILPDNLETLRAEDQINDQYKDIPYRFGANVPVSLTLNDGEWHELENGDRVWQLAVSSPGAVSLNFNFSTYNIPEGGEVFVYDADRTHFIGSFTRENMQPHGGLGVSLIHSDQLIIEYYEPANVAGEGVLEIDNITHGYRSVLHKFEDAARGPFGNSGSCNINVACEEGDGWQDQIRAVGIIVVGGNGICTGSMVNNTAEDGTPYFLTANHCLGGNVANWVFYFNHESSTCQGNTGPTNQSVSGAQVRASNSGSDFALLELNSAPPESYDVFYSGWDNSGIVPLTQTCIHHPGGDIKKITHDFDPATQSVDGGAQTWFINEWEEGTTEPGSSGSPLFDQNGRVIGQLYGGVASCTNDSYDYYGRFDVSWDGNSASTRLRDWLDPINSSATVLDGLGAAPLVPNDASALGISGVDDVLCNEFNANPVFTLRNNGLDILTSAVLEIVLNSEDVGTINWSGSLTTGESEPVQLPQLTLQEGLNVLTVSIVQPNGEADDNPSNNTSSFEFTAFLNGVEYELVLVQDDYGSETTWVVSNEDGDVLYAGGPYSDGNDGQVETHSFCLGDGCYTFTIQDDPASPWIDPDGICCDYGEGSYTLYDHFGNEFATGGEFGESESQEFCVTTVSVNEVVSAAGFSLYPNPATTEISVLLNEIFDGPTQIIVTDVTGRVMMDREVAGLNQFSLDVSYWSPGIYVLQLNNGIDRGQQRFVISR